MKAIITFGIFIFFITNIVSGQTSIIKGVVKDESGELIENVTITCKEKEVISDLNGEYSIEIPSDKAAKIAFRHPSFQTYSRRIRIRKKKVTIFSSKLTNNLTNLL